MHFVWKERQSHSGTLGATLSLLEQGEPAPLVGADWVHWTYHTYTEMSAPNTATWNKEEKRAERDVWTLRLEEGDIYRTDSVNPEATFQSAKSSFDKFDDGDITYRDVFFKLSEYEERYTSAGAWQTDTASSSDFSRYRPIEIWTRKAGSSEYTHYGTVTVNPSNGALNFKSDDGTVTRNGVNELNRIPLPENTAGLRYEHQSDFAKTNLDAYTLQVANPTDNMKALAKAYADGTGAGYPLEDAHADVFIGDAAVSSIDMASTLIKSIAQKWEKLSVWNSFEIGRYLGYKEDVPQFDDDSTNGLQTMTVRTRFGESNNISDLFGYKEWLAREGFPKRGTIYNLLPAGTTIDKATIDLHSHGRSKDSETNQAQIAVTPELIENWEGSGQTMLKVSYTLPDDFFDTPFPLSRPYFVLSYDLQNTYENIADRGTDVVITAALVSEDEDVSMTRGGGSGFSSLKEKDAFKSIEEEAQEGFKALYAQTTLGFNPVSVSEAGATKKVREDGNGGRFESTAEVHRGAGYTYRLVYTTQSSTRADSLVMYDVLENGNDTEASGWQGTFDSVDLTALEGKASSTTGKNLKPKVFYATTAPTELDVDDRTVWSETEPADKSSVKAIAIDLREDVDGNPFVLEKGSSAVVYVRMKSSTDKSDVGKAALNMLQIRQRQFSSTTAPDSQETTMLKSNAQVTLVDADVSISKTADSAGGAAEAPAAVGNAKGTPITYTVAVTSGESDYTVNDVVVEDAIPAGLAFELGDLRLTSTDESRGWGEGVALAGAAGVTGSYEGGKLKVKIASLAPSETVTLTIPTKLAADVVKTTDFVNQAAITSVLGAPTDIKSDQVAHRATRTYTLDYQVAGDDTYGVPAGATTPDSVSNIEYNTDQTLADPLTTTATTATPVADGDTVPGRWTFSGWFEAADGTEAVTSKTVTSDATVYGRWTFMPTRDVTVTKVWADDGNQDGIRPENVTLHLSANGTDTGKVTPAPVKNGDTWTYTYAGLDANDADGNPITYTVTEDKVDGYTTAVDGLTVTNAHAPETVSIPVQKIWVDSGNAKNQRPGSVTVQLKADGEDVEGKTLTLTPDGDWKDTFKGLPKYKAGAVKQLVEYSVSEVTVPGYTSVVSGNPDADGFKVTNTITGKVSVAVTKDWAGIDDSAAPAVKVQLFADGTATGDPVVLDGNANDGSWSHTFTDLPQFKNGAEINYTVAELDADGNKIAEGGTLTADGHEYTVSTKQAEFGTNSWTVTNTMKNPTVKVDVTKIWSDAENQDGMRTDTVSVALKAKAGNDDLTPSHLDGKTVDPITLNATGEWKGSFENLPTYDSKGRTIAYTVAEDNVPDGYTAAVTGTAATGFTATNTHTPGKTSVQVAKTWADADNQDGIRPDKVTVRLYADNVDTNKTIEITPAEDGTWTGSFTDLDAKKAGKAIAYTVAEDNVPEGYTAAVTGDAATGFTVTNTHDPTKRDITVTKAWDDADNQDNKRPGSVTVRLYADGSDTGKSKVLSNTNGWTATFDGLNVNRVDVETGKGGTAIAYTVIEDEPGNGYASNATAAEPLAVPADGKVTVVNSRTPETVSIPVAKSWVDDDDAKGLRSESVTIDLLADGTPVAGQELMLSADGNWAGSFTGLPRYKVGAVGQPVAYTVAERAVENYGSVISGTAVDGYTVTNTIEGKVSVAVTKAWSGIDADAAPAVKVQLLADGTAAGDPVTLDGNAENGFWSHVFEDLDQYKDGREIAYTVAELDADGEQIAEGGTLTADGHDYAVAVAQAADGSNSWTVTNTMENPAVEVDVAKVWDDAENQDGIRPETVTVTLGAEAGGEAMVPSHLDGTAVEPIELTADGSWEGSFEDLPTYDSKGRKITYAVAEESVPEGYEAEVTGAMEDGFTVINAHEVDKRDVAVAKVWDDAENKDGIRPDKVTVRLLADGEDTGKVLELTASDGWKASFEGLDVNKEGKEIEYTVSENAVEGYESAIAGTMIDGFTVTNTHEPKPVKKVKKKSLPKTGDSTALFATSAAAAGLLALAAALRRRRRA